GARDRGCGMTTQTLDRAPANAGAQGQERGACDSGLLRSQEHGVRSDWTRAEIADLFDLPFTELLFRAATVHRAHHDPVAVQRSTLLSIKTGGCPEDCGYCNQSASAETGLKASKLMDVRAVLQAAAQARDNGSTRFC